jgi:hypothetical protein
MNSSHYEKIAAMLERIKKGSGRLNPTITEWTDNGIIVTRPMTQAEQQVQSSSTAAAAAATQDGPIITELGSLNKCSKAGSVPAEGNNNNKLQTIYNFMELNKRL